MPNNVTAKTKSALRRPESVLLLAALVILVGLAITWQIVKPPTKTLQVGAYRYSLDIALTDKEHEQGLSGRRSMAANQGMVFVFHREEQQCFWMKDMNFPLDIIWLNAHHKIVFLRQNLAPSSYPQTFCSADPAAFVIELHTGEIERMNLHKGQVLNF